MLERRVPHLDELSPKNRPVVGVGAVILMDSGEVVLVKRKYPPLAGQWSLPGGKLEWGETLKAATAREALEETGLVVEVGGMVEVLDRLIEDDAGRLTHHFVLVDYLCRPRGGSLAAGSDAEAVTLANPSALDAFGLTGEAQDVIARAVRMHAARAAV